MYKNASSKKSKQAQQKEPNPLASTSTSTPTPAPPSPAIKEILIPDEKGGAPLKGVMIAPDGDVVLDVTFELSQETLRAARKAANARTTASRTPTRPGGQPPTPAIPSPSLKSTTRILYRVNLTTLKNNSKYFTSLLGDSRFAEAKSIETALEKLSLRQVKPSEAETKDLPRVQITIDDEETRQAGQEVVFGDLLRMLHGQVIAKDSLNMAYLSALAVLADRFGCAEPVARSLHGQPKFKGYKWPATPVRPGRGDEDSNGSGMALTRTAEDLLRQKIYVSWLLDLPLRFQKATGELITYGSGQWRQEFGEDDEEESGETAAWWYLPDELEDELRHRRACILRALASIPQHFVNLYSKTGQQQRQQQQQQQQCKLGYDSSTSCDSYQLGETVKFLLRKNLVSLSYFASPLPSSGGGVDFFSTTDLPQILHTLRQFPSYQIDQHHTNCGPRIRLKPILDFMEGMVSHRSVCLVRTDWVKRRDAVSWLSSASFPSSDGDKVDEYASLPPWRASNSAKHSEILIDKNFQVLASPLSSIIQTRRAAKDKLDGNQVKVFTFARSLATDQRLRFEGSMGADRLVRGLFTADEWDWTPED